MKKIRLELESLVVESFSTDDDVRQLGTVFANYSGTYICDSVSCRETCYYATCEDTACTCPATEVVGCDMSYYNACDTRASCLGQYTCVSGPVTADC